MEVLEQQEQPLDLSVRAGPQQYSQPAASLSFDFEQFYRTYQAIASRSLPAPPAQPTPVQTSPSKTRKRKRPTENFQLAERLTETWKKEKLESGVGSKNCESRGKLSKSVKSRNKHQKRNLSSIRDSCDCRFCYEDHIINLRLKTEPSALQPTRYLPWLGF